MFCDVLRLIYFLKLPCRTCSMIAYSAGALLYQKIFTNGPAGSAEAPSADQVLTQVLRQNTEALQKLALSGSGSEVSRNLESEQDSEES